MPYRFPPPDPRFRTPSAMHLSDVRDGSVYSSVLVGSGAHGVVKLFHTPMGAETLRIGDVPSDLFPAAIPLLTNMTRAAQLGDGLGDASLTAMRVDFIGGDLRSIQRVLDAATIELVVAGKRQLECGLRDLPKARFKLPILVARYDTLEARLAFDKKLDPITTLVLRCVLDGHFMTDVRCD